MRHLPYKKISLIAGLSEKCREFFISIWPSHKSSKRYGKTKKQTIKSEAGYKQCSAMDQRFQIILLQFLYANGSVYRISCHKHPPDEDNSSGEEVLCTLRHVYRHDITCRLRTLIVNYETYTYGQGSLIWTEKQKREMSQRLRSIPRPPGKVMCFMKYDKVGNRLTHWFVAEKYAE